ncbi:uncharacterized protein A1O9_01962 [Exophiala aquamarina CBS 119918]|uniref:Xylanolytic transcriptional activator regulatory domain-containing protein n=1 Tax=Exophiala aquamarina CBS 119918 TaxID=1182545 RepID=A0A072PKY6_9EURO|nr:uncharacterized protein A1O9_01962 [Exophiala aquamarina CBS 119918]KEF60402.1 hypothetical protein A1O9_01962 [Exophiala aquamarina CBS 119918]
MGPCRAKAAKVIPCRTDVATGSDIGEQIRLGLEAVDSRNALLRQLLPAIDFSKVPGLSRRHIVSLISDERDETSTSPPLDSDIANENISAAPSFGELEQADHEWNVIPDGKDSEPLVGDAINGLTLEKSTIRPGNFSNAAVLCALFTLCPKAKKRFFTLSRSFSQKHNPTPPKPDPTNGSQQAAYGENSLLPSSLSTQQAIVDGYFGHFHAIMPILDEALFRTTLSSQERTDDAWKALSNVVYALGSIATGDDEFHFFYYTRAREAINYQTLTSGSLEMLQALILLGGVYLHYINSPNTAYLILGTAFRMAILMGIHRETPKKTIPGSESRAEVRSRIWWSLVSADSWQGMLLDRPKFIKCDAFLLPLPQLPKHAHACTQTAAARETHNNDLTLEDCYRMSIRSKAEFCMILNKLQDRMAQLSPLTASEVLSFEDGLQIWNRMDCFSQAEVDEWVQSLERAIHTFKDMTPYKRPVDRYGEVVEVLYKVILVPNQEGEDDAYGEEGSESIESTGLEMENLMCMFQSNMTTPTLPADWFDHDFGFGDESAANYYPLPDF